MRAPLRTDRPSRRRVSDRPRLRRLRRLAVWGAGAALGLWVVLLVTGWELIWARKREAFTLSGGGGGTLTLYRSGWEHGYHLQAGGGGRRPGSERSIGAGVSGRTLWQLSFASMSDMGNWPALYSDGFAFNAVASMPPQEAMFARPRADLWRYRIRLWWLAAAAVAPWCVGVAVMRGRLSLARWKLARRHRPGCCHRCGYPVAGLPENSPCPECGSARA